MSVSSSISALFELERQREELFGLRSNDLFRRTLADSRSAVLSHRSSIDAAAEALKTTEAVANHFRMLKSSNDLMLAGSAAHGVHLDLVRSSPSYALSRFESGILEQELAATEFLSRTESLYGRSIFRQALEAADLAYGMQLPTALDAFRPTRDVLATQFLQVESAQWWKDPLYVGSFGATSAFARLLLSSPSVSDQVTIGSRDFLASDVLSFDSLHEYRGFLDAAGLKLPRWPRVRQRTPEEKRRLFHARLRANQQPTHVKRAKSLVHRYELTLRQIVHAAMSEAYGDDWFEVRLVECGCNDLLGKWKRKGGGPLDHADYYHYQRILAHPEHFSLVFSQGFSDPVALAELIERAGQLRAISHHARDFSPNDLRDLRVTWLTLSKGLASLVGDYEVDYY